MTSLGEQRFSRGWSTNINEDMKMKIRRRQAMAKELGILAARRRKWRRRGWATMCNASASSRKRELRIYWLLWKELFHWVVGMKLGVQMRSREKKRKFSNYDNWGLFTISDKEVYFYLIFLVISFFWKKGNIWTLKWYF